MFRFEYNMDIIKLNANNTKEKKNTFFKRCLPINDKSK